MTEIEKLTAGHPDTQSADIVAGNMEALRALFPEAFTEGKIDFEVLKQCLGGAVDEREEKYGLNWHGKRRARQIALTPSTGTLLPCPEDSVDWDTTQNLMIEGDNLEVLKLLQKSYSGKVKLIFIDPPYNTGKDFVYPDDYRNSMQNYLELTGQVESGKKITSNSEASGRYHTDWLSMMLPRLKLARNLLSQDGVIFITIDDCEQPQLRKLCDEVFGEENFIANVVWQKKYSPQNDATYFSDMHDHVLVYAKQARSSKNETDGWVIDLLPRTAEQNARYTNRDNDPRGPWKPGDASVKSYSANYDYEIVSPNGRKILPPRGRCWFTSKERMQQAISEGRIWFGQDGNNVPSVKQYLSEVQDGRVPTTWWTYQECGHNQEAKQEVNSLMGEDAGVFDTPKPVKLLRRIFEIAVQKSRDAIVLDFFAGSGSTAHALLEHNSQDGGNRRFICVQLPEPIAHKSFQNIADLTKQRIKLASRKINSEGRGVGLDTGFRVYKLATSNIRSWNPELSDLEDTLFAHTEHLVPGRTEVDILTELLLKLGLDLCVPIETKDIAGKSVHSVGAGALIVCLSDGITRETVEGLAQGIIAWWQALAPAGDTRVVFKDSAFADDVAKTNMAAILNQAGIKDMRSL